jgi:hypothetical protein
MDKRCLKQGKRREGFTDVPCVCCRDRCFTSITSLSSHSALLKFEVSLFCLSLESTERNACLRQMEGRVVGKVHIWLEGCPELAGFSFSPGPGWVARGLFHEERPRFIHVERGTEHTFSAGRQAGSRGLSVSDSPSQSICLLLPEGRGRSGCLSDTWGPAKGGILAVKHIIRCLFPFLFYKQKC